MFLTKVVLNPERTGTHKLVSNPRVMHAAVQKSFPDNGERVLWRLSTAKRDPEIFIFSQEIPSVEHIVEQAGRLNDKTGVISKDYSPVLEGLKPGQKYRLQVDANITRTIDSKKRIPIVKYDEIVSWLQRQGESHGFTISPNVLTAHKIPLTVKKDGYTVTMNRTSLDFIVTVSDKDLFANLLKNGLGRGKAYGLGLVLIAKP